MQMKNSKHFWGTLIFTEFLFVFFIFLPNKTLFSYSFINFFEDKAHRRAVERYEDELFSYKFTKILQDLYASKI